MPAVAVIGASNDRNKYGNKSLRAHMKQDYTVYPVNPNTENVEGLRAYKSVKDIPGPLDRVTLYVPPEIGVTLLADIADKAPDEFFVNPGAESDELIEKARELGLNPIQACSITDLGMSPAML